MVQMSKVMGLQFRTPQEVSGMSDMSGKAKQVLYTF